LANGQLRANARSFANIPHWRQEVRPREAAAMLGVSTGMIYLLIREGKLRSRALARNGYQRGIRLIRGSDVEALCSPAQSQEQPGHSNRTAKKRNPIMKSIQMTCHEATQGELPGVPIMALNTLEHIVFLCGKA
jgi:hypothetical protein